MKISLAGSPLLAALVLLVAGCGMRGGGPADGPSGSDEGKPTPEAWQGVILSFTPMLAQCEAAATETETKLGTFLDMVSGKGTDAAGQARKPMSEIAAKLAADKVVVTIENQGTPETPVFAIKDSFTDEGMKMAGAPPAKAQAWAKRAASVNALTGALREQAAAANAALLSSKMSDGPCIQNAKAFSRTLGGAKNGGNDVPPEVFALYAKYLKASLRNQTATSTTIASFAVLQVVIRPDGKPGSAKAVDGIVAAARESIARPVEVSPEQAKQVYEVAAIEMNQNCEGAFKAYAAKHPEQKVDPKSLCSGEGARSKAPLKGGERGSETRGEPTGEGGGGLFDAVLALVPGGSSVKAAAMGVQAIANGDPAGALRSAAAMVPAGSPLATALKTAMPLVGL